jgi:drug/metabolite transporter (DMT)-like permease
MTLYFTQPVSASVLNFLFNGEKLNILQIISIFSALIGVILIAHPSAIVPQQYLREEKS